MNKLISIWAAVFSRIVSFLGCCGLRLSSGPLVRVLARQSGDVPSLAAFHKLIPLLQSIPEKTHYSFMVPDDLVKAFNFIKSHLGNVKVIPTSEAVADKIQCNVCLFRKEFIFRMKDVLQIEQKPLHIQVDEGQWLIVSDEIISGGAPLSLEEFSATMIETQKETASGYDGTVFAVRPGTNDSQIVKEVADTYLPDVKRWIADLPAGKFFRVVDLGGHIGSFSVQVNALLSGNCEIHVYEPEPSNFAQIKKNIALNHTENIKPFNLAVSSVSGQNTLYFNPEHSGAHQLGSKLSYDTKAIPVEVVTLESVFSKWDGMPIDILKIDVESSEYDALFPAPGLVKKFGLIVGEAQVSKAHIPQDMIDFLKGMGFNVTFKGDPQHLITFAAVRDNL